MLLLCAGINIWRMFWRSFNAQRYWVVFNAFVFGMSLVLNPLSLNRVLQKETDRFRPYSIGLLRYNAYVQVQTSHSYTYFDRDQYGDMVKVEVYGVGRFVNARVVSGRNSDRYLIRSAREDEQRIFAALFPSVSALLRPTH